MTKPLLLAAALLAAAAFLPTADAWAGEPHAPHHAELAVQAAALLPPEERALIMAHQDAFRQGANDPDRVVDPYYHREDSADPEWGGAAEMAEESYRKAVAALRAGDAEEAAYQLGFMSHFLLDLSQPMHAGGWDAIANEWHSEYEEAAHAHADELRLDVRTHTPTPRAPQDAALQVVHASSARWPALERALEATGDGEPWSDEVARQTEDALEVGVIATADVMHAAFLEAQSDGTQLPMPDLPARLLAMGGIAATLLLGLTLRSKGEPQRGGRRQDDRRA